MVISTFLLMMQLLERLLLVFVPPAAATITFSNSIKILDIYHDKLLQLAQKHASITWGDDSLTLQSPKVISEITQADGQLTAVSQLTQKSKEPHSKMLAFKNNGKSNSFHVLFDDAHQVIEGQLDKYSSTDLAGLDEEMDGMTILALVLCRLHPHHKVDMYAEIGIIKMISIGQFDNDVHLYFDANISKKLAIDIKDSTAYIDNSFVQDIFQQLKHESIPLDLDLILHLLRDAGKRTRKK
jgi:hypothetical protein